MFKNILPNVVSALLVAAVISGLTLWMQHNMLSENQVRTAKKVDDIGVKLDCWYSEQIYLSNLFYTH